MAEIISRYSMAPRGCRIGVAVSGGADSAVLLHVLTGLREQLGVELAVLHVNHQLRGAASDADEEFVRQLAASLGLPIHVAQGVPAKGNLEQEARLVRRSFFAACVAGNLVHYIALGHNRDDQAETVLFRFLRGSGTAGLAGMRPITGQGLIRPLLQIGRAEIRAWAKEQGIAWREDSSNADLSLQRNRLRNEAIPYLTEHFNRNLAGVLEGTAAVARDEEDYWDTLVAAIYGEITKRTPFGPVMDVNHLTLQPRAVQRRLIRRGFHEVKGDLRSIDAQHVQAALDLCGSVHGHDRVIVPGVDVLRSFRKMRFARPTATGEIHRGYKIRLEPNAEIVLPFHAGRISIGFVNPADAFCVNFKEEQQIAGCPVFLDGGMLAAAGPEQPLFVRNWEPGDAIVRPGAEGPEKIKSLFQEHRIVLWERRHWPVVVSGTEIVWARQFGSSARFLASKESRQVLRLSFSLAEDV